MNYKIIGFDKNRIWLFVWIFLSIFAFPRVEAPKTGSVGFVLGAYTQKAQADNSTQNKNISADVTADLPRASDDVQKSKPILSSTEISLQPVKDPALISDAISAKSALVFDYDSGKILYKKNPNWELPIASLTKLMNIAVVLSDPNYNKPITITAGDKLSQAPILDLKVGDRVMPEDLIKSMLVGSANDAALTLSNHFAGDQGFIQQMNAMANELGLRRSHFSTPIGFDVAGNYSTVNDLEIVAKYALAHYPYSDIWKNNNFSFISEDGNKYSIENSNDLVFQQPNIKSVKTGYTPEALGNMIVLANDQSGRKIVAIILGSQDRDKDMLTLVNDILGTNY